MEIREVAIDVHVPVPEDADELQNFMKRKLDDVPGEPFKARPITIFRLPVWSHEINKELSEPKIVSIGPYHRGQESLLAMKEHKWSALRDFLARNENVAFEVYLQEMRLLEAQVRECYSENVNLASNDFIMMLLLDGCFILEVLLKMTLGKLDAILSAIWALGCIASDFFLLENQIPFFVIHKLFFINQGSYTGRNCQGVCPLLNLINEVKPWLNVSLEYKPYQISCSQIHHLLHLFYTGVVPNIQHDREQKDLVTGKSCLWGLQFFLPSKIFSKSGNPISESAKVSNVGIHIPCITELHEAGINFRRKREPSHMFDISFQSGIMEMPNFQINGNIKNFFWNMVFFEQSQVFQSDLVLSSYLGLMDSLINTEKDVAILARSGIIESYLQNDAQAATFFNQFGQIFGLDYSNHYFHGLYRDVKKYSESTWHKYRARLMHDYFSNPWSSISVGAASTLLVLTFLQTYYSAAK